MITLFRFLGATLLLLTASSYAEDWPQWRGPHRDGVVTDKNHPLDKLPADPKVLWKIDAGPGQSSPVLAGGKLIFLDGKDGQETAHCLNAADGTILWTVPIAPMVATIRREVPAEGILSRPSRSSLKAASKKAVPLQNDTCPNASRACRPCTCPAPVPATSRRPGTGRRR